MMNEPESDSTLDKRTTGGPRVLIVDDERCISDMLVEILQILGYSPTQCVSPHAALELLEEQDFDVILSDIRMPQMNGDEFFRKAIAKNCVLKPRFVFLTGDSSCEETQLFLSENSSRHLSKPFDIASVDQILSTIVAEQRGLIPV